MNTKNKFLSKQIAKKFKERQRIHKTKSSNYGHCKIKRKSFIRQKNLQLTANDDERDERDVLEVDIDIDDDYTYNYSDYNKLSNLYMDSSILYSDKDKKYFNLFICPINMLIKCESIDWQNFNDLNNYGIDNGYNKYNIYKMKHFMVKKVQMSINIVNNNNDSVKTEEIKIDGIHFLCNIESFNKELKFDRISNNILINDELILNHRIWGIHPSHQEIYSNVNTIFRKDRPYFFNQNNIKNTLISFLNKNMDNDDQLENDRSNNNSKISVFKDISRIIVEYLYFDNNKSKQTAYPGNKFKNGTCPRYHGLSKFYTLEDDLVTHFCAICGKAQPGNSLLFGCRRCDYDLCQSCFTEYKKNYNKDNNITDKDNVCWMKLEGEMHLSYYLLTKLSEYYIQSKKNFDNNNDCYFMSMPWPLYIRSNNWYFFDDRKLNSESIDTNCIHFPSKRKY